MDNASFENKLADFALDRISESRQRLNNDPAYKQLNEKHREALHNLIGDNPEIRARFRTLEDIEGQIEVYHDFQSYMQGVRDSMSLKEIL